MPWNPLEPALLADVNIAELLRSDLKVLYAEIRLVVMRLMELYQVSVSAPPAWLWSQNLSCGFHNFGFRNEAMLDNSCKCP
jgi:hypothetical protein